MIPNDSTSPIDKHLAKWIETLRNDALKPVKMGDFTKFTFPIILQPSFPVISNQILSAQPMTTGAVNFYEVKPKKTPLQELTERVWAEDDPSNEE